MIICLPPPRHQSMEWYDVSIAPFNWKRFPLERNSLYRFRRKILFQKKCLIVSLSELDVEEDKEGDTLLGHLLLSELLVGMKYGCDGRQSNRNVPNLTY